jgi:hypothetical protein
VENGSIDVSELGVDRRERGYRVPFAEDEHVLAQPGRISDVQTQETAVVERDERYGRGEGTAGMETLVHGLPALLQCQQPDI